MTKPDKLLPCPFCPKSRLTFIGRDDWDDDKNRVQCNTCGTETSVAVWNTRTPDPVLAELVEHCKDHELRWDDPEIFSDRLSDIVARLEPETKGELPRIKEKE